MSHQPDSHRHELILNYLLPAFGVAIADNLHKAEDIMSRFRLKDMVRAQRIESPGLPEEGCLFFSLSALVHSYQYCFKAKRMFGTMIWKRRSFIFSHLGLINNEKRTDFIEMLENGEVLYISYANLIYLMDKYPEIKNTINGEIQKQHVYVQKRQRMLFLPAVERARWLRTTHPDFIAVASQEIQSIHTKMSLRSYVDQLKKLK